MQVIYTSDVSEARLCRRAQYSGAITAVSVGDIVATGIVHSVMEEKSSESQRWTIKIIPKEIPNFKPALPRGTPSG
ncbi:hypothetical protein [Rhodopseudomonas sp. RCAM05734]|uniref:hypothetical protein n=1 Tax=Rhodopseudomonas sp. RCAM05734 TaxID=3457549 RepID=UPI004044B964